MDPLKPHIVEVILEQMALGKSLRSICRAKGMPSIYSVLRRLGTDAEFAQQYARARECRADLFAEEITEIADNPGLAPDDKRVRMNSRKWAAGKMKPKAYGEKQVIETTTLGADGRPIDPRGRDEADKAAWLRRLTYAERKDLERILEAGNSRSDGVVIELDDQPDVQRPPRLIAARKVG